MRVFRSKVNRGLEFWVLENGKCGFPFYNEDSAQENLPSSNLA